MGAPRTVTWNGVEYPSLTDAATAMGVSANTLKYRLERGYTCDADVNSDQAKAVTWNGVEYPSINKLAALIADATNAEINTVKAWIRVGCQNAADVEAYQQRQATRTRSVVWNGVAYASITAAAAANGVHVNTMRYRIEAGYTCDDDMARPEVAKFGETPYKTCAVCGEKMPRTKEKYCGTSCKKKAQYRRWKLNNPSVYLRHKRQMAEINNGRPKAD